MALRHRRALDTWRKHTERLVRADRHRSHPWETNPWRSMHDLKRAWDSGTQIRRQPACWWSPRRWLEAGMLGLEKIKSRLGA